MLRESERIDRLLYKLNFLLALLYKLPGSFLYLIYFLLHRIFYAFPNFCWFPVLAEMESHHGLGDQSLEWPALGKGEFPAAFFFASVGFSMGDRTLLYAVC
jgi:hypothetical protein